MMVFQTELMRIEKLCLLMSQLHAEMPKFRVASPRQSPYYITGLRLWMWEKALEGLYKLGEWYMH